jgi:hypothetical protein
MKNIVITFTLVLISTQFVLAQQSGVTKNPSFSIRANGNYQYFSFNGRSTNSMALGGIIEKTINFESTAGIAINYLTRMEDGSVQNANMPSYQEVLYFAPFVRKYFDKALDGMYSGFTVGIGIPQGKGTQWDFGGMLGYNILNNKLSVDINLNLGFGSFRHYENTNTGIVSQEVFLVDYGFYFRPGISIGLAN